MPSSLRNCNRRSYDLRHFFASQLIANAKGRRSWWWVLAAPNAVPTMNVTIPANINRQL
jgi:hypothetical protein